MSESRNAASDRRILWITIAITIALAAILFRMIWTGTDPIGHKIVTSVIVGLLVAVKVGGYAYAATRPPTEDESLEEDQR